MREDAMAFAQRSDFFFHDFEDVVFRPIQQSLPLERRVHDEMQ